eukprot:CAMPEP_0184368322 /NCGR_PEP_ID=MMETSP1089-20130417/161583_1 /TAXON_ID=38269 ORGANISM="Gloeochaete wittrockiana, Strain SAG46.84" /NCGR_SAMPLE_ID=MMETSP1089 /ASSEMBLY_ACC=CAM_ASM_000445 /LENGTH=197 /DNA_ID=CAMNT_0026710559 /DNA_START=222 /DNA_END=816 /DNA_ORIENTATION=+
MLPSSVEHIKSLWSVNDLSDVRILILGKEYNLHKAILVQSPYFAVTFSERWRKCDSSIPTACSHTSEQINGARVQVSSGAESLKSTLDISPMEQNTTDTDTSMTEAEQDPLPVLEKSDESEKTTHENTNEHNINHDNTLKRRKTQWTQEDKQTCTQCGDALGNHVDQWAICRTRGRIYTEAIALHQGHTQFGINVLS